MTERSRHSINSFSVPNVCGPHEDHVAAGLVLREGSGRKTDPFRYWLAGQEDKWRQDPMYEFRQMMEANNRKMRERVRKPA